MHIVGVPIIENCTRVMKKQVGKSQLFTKESLTKIQDKMRTACIKSFNKFYDRDIKLKEKQKMRLIKRKIIERNIILDFNMEVIRIWKTIKLNI